VANPIGVFFDPDSACDAQKAAANTPLYGWAAESALPFDFPRYCLLAADIRGGGLPTFALFA